MVYTQQTRYPRDIWRIPGRGASARNRQPEKLIVSSGNDYHPAYSPDGRRIAFSSTRSGVGNIWVCDGDGSNPVQLTNHESPAGTAHWSPDGRRIVFDSYEAGDYNLYVIDAEGGIPRRLTHEPSDEVTGTWSQDGQWIYSHSDRSGEGQIWKIPAEGGEAVQVTQGGAGPFPQVSPDGRYLYYSKSDPASRGLWRVPVGGGEEAEVFSGPIDGRDWVLSRSGIYYRSGTVHGRRGEHAILYLDIESGQATELFRAEGAIGFGAGLAVSPDEDWILFGEWPAAHSELMSVENFR
jgi:Tol biopolymer transport system component